MPKGANSKDNEDVKEGLSLREKRRRDEAIDMSVEQIAEADGDSNATINRIRTLLSNDGLINSGSLVNEGIINVIGQIHGNSNRVIIVGDFSKRAKVGSDALFRGDKLILRGLTFHGLQVEKPAETTSPGQKYLVDIDAWMYPQETGASRLLTETDNDNAVYRTVKAVFEVPRSNLALVAEKIATTIMEKHDRISAVRVKVEKPHVAAKGSKGIEIFREKKN